MKKVLLIILSIVFILKGYCQKEVYQDFETFWRVFKTAVSKNDKQAVSRLTEHVSITLPHHVQVHSEQEFLNLYNRIITPKVKQLIMTQTPKRWSDDTKGYSIPFNKKENIIFYKDNTKGWQFVGISEYY